MTTIHFADKRVLLHDIYVRFLAKRGQCLPNVPTDIVVFWIGSVCEGACPLKECLAKAIVVLTDEVKWFHIPKELQQTQCSFPGTLCLR